MDEIEEQPQDPHPLFPPPFPNSGIPQQVAQELEKKEQELEDLFYNPLPEIGSIVAFIIGGIAVSKTCLFFLPASAELHCVCDRWVYNLTLIVAVLYLMCLSVPLYIARRCVRQYGVHAPRQQPPHFYCTRFRRYFRMFCVLFLVLCLASMFTSKVVWCGNE